jgi:hypothetical protein
MSSIKELTHVSEMRDQYNPANWGQVEYCLTDFPSPFYVVEIPQVAKTNYNRFHVLLQWLNEQDDCGGNYIADAANGFFYFKDYSEALNFYLTFGDVTFN